MNINQWLLARREGRLAALPLGLFYAMTPSNDAHETIENFEHNFGSSGDGFLEGYGDGIGNLDLFTYSDGNIYGDGYGGYGGGYRTYGGNGWGCGDHGGDNGCGHGYFHDIGSDNDCIENGNNATQSIYIDRRLNHEY